MFTGNWPDLHVAALKQRFAEGMSFAQIAADINAAFGTSYSRSGCIGKAHRIGLAQANKPQPKPKREKSEPVIHLRKPQLPRAICEEIRIDLPVVEPRRVSIYELDDDTCRWPISSPGQPDFCFCGNTPIKGLPYCGGHSRLAYRVFETGAA
jgi:GcrA cell cycle regulator